MLPELHLAACASLGRLAACCHQRLHAAWAAVDLDFHFSDTGQRYPSRSSSGTRLGMNVPVPRAISLPSPSTSTPSPMISRFVRLTTVPRAVITPTEIGRRK